MAESPPAKPSEPTAAARLTLDLGALVANWRTIATAAPGAEIAAVLKADGYGIGLERTAAALSRAGCRTFFVATPGESVRLRAAAPEAALYILDGLLPGAAASYAAADLRPVLGSLDEAREWAATRQGGVTTGCAIHVDTGMNRLGLSLAEARLIAGDGALLRSLAPSLIVSHLACADTPGHTLNAKQLAAFRTVRELFPAVPASLANSAGVFLGPDYRFDMVRPGIALYGAQFIADRPPLTTVVTAEAMVLRVRDAAAGETVGYGATWTAPAPARIAILAAGYADGYHRAASSADDRNGARVFIRGAFAPIVGRVSMDLIAIDVTHIPGVARGDWAELFGPNVPVDDVAAFAGTIGYELLTGLGSRYARRYVGG